MSTPHEVLGDLTPVVGAQPIGHYTTAPGENPLSMANLPNNIDKQTLLQMLGQQMERPRIAEAKVDLRTKVGGVGGRLLFWEYLERTRRCMKYDINSLGILTDECVGKAALICGGGPSLKYDVPKIRELQRQGGLVITTNKTHDYFQDAEWLATCPGADPTPIIPYAHVMLDPMPWVAGYVKQPIKGVKYLIAASCDPAVLRGLRLKGADVYLWHAGADFYGQSMPHPILQTEFPKKLWCIVIGATTVGLRSVPLSYQLGCRVFHLFGLDSSAASVNGEYKMHAYPKDKPPDADEGVVTLNTKRGSYDFYVNTHLSRQATDFVDMLDEIAELVKAGTWGMVNIVVWGKGMLPTYAASIGLHGLPEMNMEYSGVSDAGEYRGASKGKAA